MAVKPASRSCNTRTFMGMIGGRPSIKMAGLVISFQSEEKISMVAEALKEYSLASAEAACEDPMEQAPMVFMASGVEFHDGNTSHW